VTVHDAHHLDALATFLVEVVVGILDDDEGLDEFEMKVECTASQFEVIEYVRVTGAWGFVYEFNYVSAQLVVECLDYGIHESTLMRFI
jgi:hypothetical protein